MTNVGDYIRKVRIERRLRQRALADKAGVSASTLHYIENGKTLQPDTETLKAIETALGLPPGTLLTEAGYVSSQSYHSRLVEMAAYLLEKLPEKYQQRLFKRWQREFDLTLEEMAEETLDQVET